MARQEALKVRHLSSHLGFTLGVHTWGPHLGSTLGVHTWGPHLGSTLGACVYLYTGGFFLLVERTQLKVEVINQYHSHCI